MEGYLVGGLLTLILEAAKHIAKRKGVEFTKFAIIGFTIVVAIAYAFLSQASGFEEWVMKGWQVFSSATAIYATLWKYLILPTLESIAEKK